MLLCCCTYVCELLYYAFNNYHISGFTKSALLSASRDFIKFSGAFDSCLFYLFGVIRAGVG